jgi:hypothetical protein
LTAGKSHEKTSTHGGIDLGRDVLRRPVVPGVGLAALLVLAFLAAFFVILFCVLSLAPLTTNKYARHE